MVIITTLNYLGPIGEVIINVLLITSMFACVLSFHNVITRYQHSMSNAGVMPQFLGRVQPYSVCLPATYAPGRTLPLHSFALRRTGRSLGRRLGHR